MRVFVRIFLFFILGVSVGSAGTAYLLSKNDHGLTQMAYQAYRLGCVQTGSQHLWECDDKASTYRMRLNFLFLGSGLEAL